MKEFDDFKKIFNKLTDNELNFEIEVRSKKNGKTSYHQKLLKCLGADPNSTLQNTQVFIYGCIKPIAFKQLLFRSKELLLESIILNDSIENYPTYDHRAREILLLRKRLLQFDVLVLRGLNSIAVNILNSVIGKAKLYEYYDVLVFALVKKMRQTILSTTLNEYSILYKEVEHFEDCRDVFRKSEFYIKKMHLHVNTKHSIREHQNNLKNFIFELENDVLRVKSKTTLYNLFRLKCDYFEFNEDYSSCRQELGRIQLLLSNNKFINSDFHEGMIHLNKGIYEMKSYLFEDANNSLKKALPILKNHYANEFLVYQHKFLLHFYTADKKNIELTLSHLNSFEYSGLIVHYFAATVRYYNACIKFIQQDYSSSYLLLNDVKDLEQDKESWNISIRILSIMNQIELENYEFADNLIENLRKHYERISKLFPVSKRDEKIIKVLIALSGHSYHFRKTFRIKAELFQQLDSLEKDFRWRIMSPEMIIFHEWFKQKTKDLKYDHFELMPLMKKKYSVLYKAFVPLPEDAEITQ